MLAIKKFFLASASDLAAERDHVELLILRKNHELAPRGLLLEVVRWEGLSSAFHPLGVQTRFSEELRGCDAVVFLFHTRLGGFTKEEFDLAYDLMTSGQNPKHILVFFKSTGSLASVDGQVLAV